MEAYQIAYLMVAIGGFIAMVLKDDGYPKMIRVVGSIILCSIWPVWVSVRVFQKLDGGC